MQRPRGMVQPDAIVRFINEGNLNRYCPTVAPFRIAAFLSIVFIATE
jgi:hypothetical protein